MGDRSTRNERCGNCGDPFFVCPASAVRRIRCCAECTHRVPADDEWRRVLEQIRRQRRRYGMGA